MTLPELLQQKNSLPVKEKLRSLFRRGETGQAQWVEPKVEGNDQEGSRSVDALRQSPGVALKAEC